MGNKEDWEELEKWAENEKVKNIETFKLDLDNVDMQKKAKKVNTVVRFLNKILKIIKKIYLLFVIFIALSTLIFLYTGFSNMKSRFNADIGSIEDMNHIKIKILSQDTDDRGNGTYIMALKNKQEIQFKAIKDYGKLSDDYHANFQKYIFNNWDNDLKEKFEVKENINNNGLLSYENYIIVDNIEELEKATEYIIDFLEYAEKWNKENKIVKIKWQKDGQFIVPIYNIYIQFQERIIYPYHAMFQTADEIREESKNLYN